MRADNYEPPRARHHRLSVTAQAFDADKLAELRRVAEDHLAPPSARVAARQALRDYRQAQIKAQAEAERRALIEASRRETGGA
jgi:hypothetical protein